MPSKPARTGRSRRTFLPLAALFAGFLPPAAPAQTTVTWANTGTDFATNANWTGGTAPNNTNQTAFFNSASPVQPNLAASRSIGGLRFGTSAGAYTLGGSGTLTLSSGIDNQNTTVAQTVTVPLALADHNTFTAAGALTVSGDIANNGFNLLLAGAGSLGGGLISGAISGAGALQKVPSGAGTWTLTGTNTYTGGTTVSAGTLQIGDGGTTGSIVGNVVISSGATLAFNRADALTFSSNVIGAGSLRQSGEGTLTLTGNSFYSGGVTLAAGVLALGSANAIGSSGAISFTGGTLRYGASNTTDYSARFSTAANQAYRIDTNGQNVTFASALTSADGTLAKSGEGALTLSGDNTYTGGTTIMGGTLALGSDGALGSNGTISFAGGTLQYSGSNTTDYSARFSTAANQQYRFDTNGLSVTFATALTSSGGTLAKSGAGEIRLTGDNTYAGGTSIEVGTLQIGNGGTTGSLVGDVSVASGATLAFNRSEALTLSGVISGAGALTKIASGGTWTLTGENTYTGGTTISFGTLQIGDGGASGSIVGDVVINNLTALVFNRSDISAFTGNTSSQGMVRKRGTGTLILTGNMAHAGGTFVEAGAFQVGNGGTLGSLAGNVSLSSGATLAFNRSNSLTFADAISGAGALTKTGAGTLTLSGANTYTGGTTIEAGTLALGSTGAIGTSGVISFTGGTLQYSASNTTDYSGRFSTALNQIIRLDTNGQNVSWANLTNRPSNSLVKSGAGTLAFTGAVTYQFTAVTVAEGTLQVGNGSSTTGVLDSNVEVLGGATLAFNRPGTFLPFSNQISGEGALMKGGASTLTLTGNNTYTGGTTINGGTLALGGADAIGASGVISFTGGTLQYSASNTADYSARFSTAIGQSYSFDTNGQDVTLAGALTSFGGSLAKSGAGTLTLTGASTYNFGTAVSAGTLQIGNGGATGSIAGNVSVADGAALAFNRSDESTFSGVISGAGSLVKSGSGLLILTGHNSHGYGNESGTFINSGTLQIGNGGANGSISDNVSVADGATLAFNRSGEFSFSGAVSGAGSLVKSGSGLLILRGGSALTGGTTINEGELRIGGRDFIIGGSLISGSLASDVAISSGATLSFNRPDAVTFSGAISGAGRLVKHDANTLALTGDATQTGGTFINSGTLQIGDGGTTGSLEGSVEIASGATLAFARANAHTFSGAASGAGSLLKSSGGTLALTGDNTYTGGTTIASGTLELGASDRLADGGAVTINGTGAFALGSFNETVGAVTLNGGSITGSGTLTGASFAASGGALSASLAGSAALTKSGAGTLTLTGDNTYTGGTTINGGVLALGSASALGSSGTISFTGGTLRYGASNTTDYSARFSTAVGQSYRFDTNGQDVTLTGALTSFGGTLAKSGAGTLTLTGASTYNFGTTVSAGTLQIGNGGATGSIAGNVSVADGATLAFNRFNALTFSGVISGAGSLVKSGSGILILTGHNTYDGGTAINAGTLQIGSGESGSIAGNVSVADGATLAFNRTGETLFAGAVAGAGSLVKSGSGMLLLTGESTFTGGTTINAGELRIGDGTASGSLASDVAISGGAALAFSRPDAVTFSGAISGAGLLVKLDANTLTLTGDATQTGGTFINSGALQIGDGGTSGSLAGEVGLANNSTLAFNRSGALTFAGTASGSGSLLKSGAGTLTLSGNNTYDGDTFVEAGTLAMSSSSAVGSSGTVAVAAGATLDTAAFGFDLTRASGAGTITGSGTFTHGSGGNTTLGVALAGNASLVKSGAGTLTLSGNSTFTGGTMLGAGTLAVAHDSALGAGALTLAGGALQAGGGSRSLANAVTLTTDTTIGGADALTLSGAFTLDGFKALNVTNTATTTISGGIGETSLSTFIKQGGGLLALTGTNTYTGGTFITAGTLQVGNGGATGNVPGSVSISSGATLAFNRSDAAAFSGVASGGGSLLKRGAGTLTLAGNNTHTGGTTIEAGTLALGASDRLANTGALTLTGGTFALGAFNETVGAVTLNSGAITGTGTLTATSFAASSGAISASLAGNATLAKAGAGTLTLSGGNTYTGGTTLSAGTLAAGHDSALGTGALTFAGGALLASGGARTLANAVTLDADTTIGGADALTLSGAFTLDGFKALNVTNTATTTISGGIGETSLSIFIKQGAGLLALTGTNTYTGGTFITAGTLQVGNGGATGVLPGSVSISNGATLAFNRSDAVAFSDVASGGGSLLKLGAGTLTLSGANTYTGGTALNAGTLALGASDRLADNGSLTLNGGTFALGAFNETVGAVTLNSGAITGTGTLTATSFAASAGAISSALAGNAALTKSGAGTLILTGANTYTAGTLIGAGTVRIDNVSGSAFGTGAVTVADGATLTGAGSFTGAFQNNGIFAPGNSPTLQTLSSFTQGPTGILQMELGGLLRGLEYDALDIAGAFVPGGTLEVVLYGGFNPTTAASFDLFNWGSISGTFASVNLPAVGAGLAWDTTALYSTGTLNLTVAAIPEPGASAAIGGALALLLVLLRRRFLQCPPNPLPSSV